MDTFWAIVTIAAVVAIVGIAGYVFVVAPFRHHTTV